MAMQDLTTLLSSLKVYSQQIIIRSTSVLDAVEIAVDRAASTPGFFIFVFMMFPFHHNIVYYGFYL